MKKIFVRFCLTALGSFTALTAANAQTLPNGTLETWSTRNSALAPTGWFTFDDLLASIGFPFPTATTTRSTDKHAGTYAAQLESKSNPLLQAVIPGILGIGSNPTLESEFPGGIPFTARPASMQFYYKLTGTGAADETAAAQVVLTKWDGTQSNPVAGAAIELTPSAGYTLVTLPLDYLSSVAPDSLRILFVSSTADEPTVGRVLLIDDVVMTGTALPVRNAARNEAVSVYPNPSADGLFMLTHTKEASWSRAAYTVTDATGRVVLRQAAASANSFGPRRVDLRGQGAGVYTLRLETPEGPVVQKLLIP
ncbi:T9SS type A sorting domain-containing protein [Hymenobacter sp. BT635]|uniref:T9SS type A sorting domain-containing protein n=1 Tax=Hymenobacter nitidus TaxID=2880929 RepID=A0ABS8ADU1_9BACT|nr:T9SS type A sorting domain-containing protein [Hymenobacter nitidus]MCB2378314.1 T9SS type A sorting domain-containing protein [Hymenobacter nitidus]